MPYIPLTLSLGNRSVEVRALLDSGANINVIPYEVGLALGAIWENQTVSIILGHMNFFREFDVCFYSSRSEFEVRPKNNV